LILRLPPTTPTSQRVVDAQVRGLDVAPTIFDLLGIDKPDWFVGASLIPLMAGEETADRIAFSESTLYGADKLSWRIEQYKYIVDLNPAAPVPEELYDWRNDPGETHNLLTTLPDVADRLRRQLNTFHDDLVARARTMSQPAIKDMSPREIERLKSLGYIR